MRQIGAMFEDKRAKNRGDGDDTPTKVRVERSAVTGRAHNHGAEMGIPRTG